MRSAPRSNGFWRSIRIVALLALVALAAAMLGGTSAHALGAVTVTVSEHGSPIASSDSQGDFTLALSATNNSGGPVHDTAKLTLDLPSGVTPDLSANCTGSGPYVCPISLDLATNDSNKALPDLPVHANPSSGGTHGGLTGSGTTDTTAQAIDVPDYSIFVDQQADLQMVLTGVPSDVIAGGSDFTATATVTNWGPSDSGSGWTASVTLPSSNLVFGSTPGCSAVNLVATCSGSNLAPNGTAAFQVHVRAPHDAAAGNQKIDAAVDPGSVSEGSDANSDTDSATVIVDQQADLGMVLTGVPAHVVAGGSDFTATATVTNYGPSDSGSGWSASVSLPSSNLAIASTDCNVVDLIATCSGSNLAPNGTAGFQVHISAPFDAAAGAQQIDAAVQPGSVPEGANAKLDTSNETVTVDQQADLTVSLQNTVSNPPVVAGGPSPGTGSFSTQATVTNAGGPSDSHGYQVTYQLSTTAAGQSLDDVKFSALPGTCAYTPVSSNDTVVCTSSTNLAPSGGGDVEAAPLLRVDAASQALGSYTVTATVAPIAPVTDPGPSLDTDAVSTSVEAHADLSVSAMGPETPQIAGKSTGFDYTLTVLNGGPSVDHGGYTAHLPLESGVTFSTTGSTTGCQAAGNGVDCSSSADFASGATKAYTVHVTTDPGIVPDDSQISGIDLTDTATVALATVSLQSDPDLTNNHSDAITVHINAQADLALGETITHGAGVPPYVAGDSTNGALTYQLTVTNGGESTHKGSFTVTDTLPAGFIFQATSTAGCTNAGQQVTCTDSGAMAPNGTKVFNVDVKITSHVLDGTYKDGTSPTVGGTVTTGSTATQEPSGTGGNNTGTPQSAKVITVANLQVTLESASPTTLSANAANSVTFTLTVQNNGPSDTQGVNVASPTAGASGKPAFLFTDPNPVTGELDALASRTITIHGQANPALGHGSPMVSGPFTITDSSTVTPTSPTTQTDTSKNVKSNAMNVTINTAPSPPQNPSAAAGNTNVVVSWKAPVSDGIHPVGQGNPFTLDSTTPYRINVYTVTQPNNTLTRIRQIPVPASAVQSCLTNAAGVCFNVGIGPAGTQNAPLPNDTTYAFGIQAQNSVDWSDEALDSHGALPTAKPNKLASATIVPPTTTKTLTTCTSATSAQPMCIQYALPSGAGGVAGVQGDVLLGNKATFCLGGCTGNAAFDLVSSGYNALDVNHPILETILWDSTEGPNSIKSVIWYQSTNPNVHGGQPFPLPTCVKSGVANPDPCLKSINVLGAKQTGDPNAQGDLQVKIYLTSDKDGLTSKH